MTNFSPPELIKTKLAKMTDSTKTQLLGNSPIWKKPDEVMQLHRLKRKKKALQVSFQLHIILFNYHNFYVFVQGILRV